MYALAASAALSIYGAAKAAKAQAEEATANNIAATEKRRLEFNREQQAYMQNMNALSKQNTADNFNIGLAAAEAQDQLALARAGSGLSGASVNELDDEISRSVGADRVAANRAMIDGQDNLDRNRINANENRLLAANQSRSQDYTRGIKDSLLGAAAPFIGKAIDSAVTNESKTELSNTTKKTNYSYKGGQSVYGVGAFIS